MKSGLYATYQGAEYEAAKTADGRVKLVFRGTDPPEGFAPTPYHNSVKTVRREEVSALVLVKSYAIYCGERFEIADETPNGFVIATSDQKAAERVGMDKTDRMDFRKQIHAEEADDVIEERRAID